MSWCLSILDSFDRNKYKKYVRADMYLELFRFRFTAIGKFRHGLCSMSFYSWNRDHGVIPLITPWMVGLNMDGRRPVVLFLTPFWNPAANTDICLRQMFGLWNLINRFRDLWKGFQGGKKERTKTPNSGQNKKEFKNL